MPLYIYIDDVVQLAVDQLRTGHVYYDEIVDAYIDLQTNDEDKLDILKLYGNRDLGDPGPEPMPLHRGWSAIEAWWERLRGVLAYNALYAAALEHMPPEVMAAIQNQENDDEIRDGAE